LHALKTKSALPEFKAQAMSAKWSRMHLQMVYIAKPPKRWADDVAEQAFIRVQHQLNQHLWVLDAIVTAAPLLGLLGTILGIFDTFTALAESGIFGPSGRQERRALVQRYWQLPLVLVLHSFA
jgi:biopolymer transport protein ExbB/TolQ